MNYHFKYDVNNFDYKEETEIINNTDVLLVTVNEAERESFLKYILPVPKKNCIVNIVHNKESYRIGRLGHYLVAHVESSMGSIDRDASFSTVFSAIDSIKPKVVIMVGVAFGINPRKQSVGDVLISKTIANYEISRVNAASITPRGSKPQSGPLLGKVFSSIIDWNHYLRRNKKAKIIFGELLSGEKLIDNIDYRKELKNVFPKAIGGEMEASGLSSACNRKSINEWIIIKGICDWADGKKHKKLQPKAAKSAMALAFHVLSNEYVFDDLKIFSYPKKLIFSEKKKYTIDASKGSPLWTLNRIRSSVLPMLVKDLKRYENIGCDDEISKAIRKDLGLLFDEISTLPKTYNGGQKLISSFEKFMDSYDEWCRIDGESEFSKMARIRKRETIKKHRNEISKIIRLTQGNLSAIINETNKINLFKYQIELLEKFSDVLPNFKRAVLKINKRIDKIDVDFDLIEPN